MALIATGLVLVGDADISSDNLSIYFEDETGIYDSVLNPGGFGGGVNPMTSDATVATLTISMPDPTTYQANNNNQFVINAFPTLPNVLDNKFNVPNYSLGLANTDSLPDGQYQAVYFISGNFSANKFQNSYTFVFYNLSGISCCLDKKGAKFDDDCECDNDSDFIAYMHQRNMLNQCCNLIGCGGSDEDICEMIKSLSQACQDCGCSGN
jgi:hypothetical protein